MKPIRIPKKSGGTRLIYAVHSRELAQYRCMSAIVESVLSGQPGQEHAVGFRPRKNILDAARRHVGFQYTLCMDLAEFFDSVTESHLIEAGLAREFAAVCCVDGAARQGLPSSPAAANLAALPMDRAIAALLPADAVYTRYADDLTISANDIGLLKTLRDTIPDIAQRHGFTINAKKTRMQSAQFGRRIILGLAVGDTDVTAPRSLRRRLRAALHASPNSARTRGLAEMVALKPANPDKPNRCEQALRKAVQCVSKASYTIALAPRRKKTVFFRTATPRGKKELHHLQISVAIGKMSHAEATALML